MSANFKEEVTKIHLNFQGYWRESAHSALPDRAGIFCVYRSVYDSERGTLAIRQLLYIGETTHMRATIFSHPLRARWEGLLREDEELCFNFAPAVIDRKQAAAALIQQHRPVCNDPADWQLACSFSRPPVEMLLSGRIQLLNYSFTSFTRKEVTVSLRTVVPSAGSQLIESLSLVEA